jgi:hypothetical protein
LWDFLAGGLWVSVKSGLKAENGFWGLGLGDLILVDGI